MTELRAWQDAALVQVLNSNKDFLVVACPGAGKTRLALIAIQRLIDRDGIHPVIVVVPTTHLRKQWADAAHELGIQLDHRFVSGTGVLSRDFDGLVVTYAAVATEPMIYRKLSSGNALVVLDEIHHGGDTLTWGNAVKTAFDQASRRLLLSGTPTRTDRAQVPFIHYDEKGMFVADHGHGYSYDYGTAIQDHAVRPIEFLALDGQVRWREAGAIVSRNLASTDEDSRAKAVNTALDPQGDWIHSVLNRANAELTRHRLEVHDAAGLVIAADQYMARAYATILHKVTGEEPVLAISDEPDSSDRIKNFGSEGATGRWIIAVQMLSEGVDIPRLTIGVYASRITTDLFFRQVVGRFVRIRVEDETTPTLLIPSIEPLLGYARTIEKTVNAALRQEQEKIQRESSDAGQTVLFDLVEPVDSSAAVHHSTILSGDEFTDGELRRAQQMIEVTGLPSAVTAAQIARVLKLAGTARVVGTAALTPNVAPNLADQKVSARRLIQNKVGRLNRVSGKPHSHIHADLNVACGDKTDVATLATLNKRMDLLDTWIEQARE